MFSALRSGLSNATRRLRSQEQTAPPLSFEDYVSERLGLWNSAPPLEGALVFLGDSQIERGLWSEWWKRGDILNRGIGGQTTEGVRQRLDEVVRHRPRLIVVECGTNDLATGASVETAARSYHALLEALQERLPSAVLWPQSVLPVHPHRWRDATPSVSAQESQKMNAQLRQLNTLLSDIAQKRSLSFHDLSPVLEEDEILKSSCTLDGTHLNGEGYRVWREAMKRNAPPEVAAILGNPRE